MANLHSFSRRGLLLGGGVAMTTMALAACGGSTGASSSSTSSDTSDAKVSLTFWGWAPGYKEAVELWNKKNPNTQVKWIATEASRKIYPKMLTAVKANNAPDLAQLGSGRVGSGCVVFGRSVSWVCVEQISRWSFSF